LARKNSKRANNTIGAAQLQARISSLMKKLRTNSQHFCRNDFDYFEIICMIRSSSFRAPVACEVEGAVEVRRGFSAGDGPVSRDNHRIIDHELDMVRRSERAPVVASGIARVFKWLMPARRPVAPPMRSIARQLEEAFPAGDY